MNLKKDTQMDQYNTGEIILITAAVAFAIAAQITLGAWLASIFSKED